MLSQPPYLSLKQAARLLGVHEQTLRSWERQGLMRMARLPKSGYRRVPTAEVERLQALMLAAASPASIYLAPPRQDAAARQQADALADAVRVELAQLEEQGTLDDLMADRRGRVWLP